MIHDPVLREVASYACEALVFVVIFVGFHIAHRPDDDAEPPEDADAAARAALAGEAQQKKGM